MLDWTGGTDFRITEHNVVGCEVQGNVIITTRQHLEAFYEKVREACGPETPYTITGYLRVWNQGVSPFTGPHISTQRTENLCTCPTAAIAAPAGACDEPGSAYVVEGKNCDERIRSLAPLQFLQRVGESGGHSIDIHDNAWLLSMDGLSGLVGPLPGSVNIDHNPRLSTLFGIEAVTAVGKDISGKSLRVWSNPTLCLNEADRTRLFELGQTGGGLVAVQSTAPYPGGAPRPKYDHLPSWWEVLGPFQPKTGTMPECALHCFRGAGCPLYCDMTDLAAEKRKDGTTGCTAAVAAHVDRYIEDHCVYPMGSECVGCDGYNCGEDGNLHCFSAGGLGEWTTCRMSSFPTLLPSHSPTVSPTIAPPFPFWYFLAPFLAIIALACSFCCCQKSKADQMKMHEQWIEDHEDQEIHWEDLDLQHDHHHVDDPRAPHHAAAPKGGGGPGGRAVPAGGHGHGHGHGKPHAGVAGAAAALAGASGPKSGGGPGGRRMSVGHAGHEGLTGHGSMAGHGHASHGHHGHGSQASRGPPTRRAPGLAGAVGTVQAGQRARRMTAGHIGHEGLTGHGSMVAHHGAHHGGSHGGYHGRHRPTLAVPRHQPIGSIMGHLKAKRAVGPAGGPGGGPGGAPGGRRMSVGHAGHEGLTGHGNMASHGHARGPGAGPGGAKPGPGGGGPAGGGPGGPGPGGPGPGGPGT